MSVFSIHFHEHFSCLFVFGHQASVHVPSEQAQIFNLSRKIWISLGGRQNGSREGWKWQSLRADVLSLLLVQIEFESQVCFLVDFLIVWNSWFVGAKFNSLSFLWLVEIKWLVIFNFLENLVEFNTLLLMDLRISIATFIFIIFWIIQICLRFYRQLWCF